MLAHELFDQIRARHEKATAVKDMATVAQCAQEYGSLLNSFPDDVNLLFSTATAHMQIGSTGVAVCLLEKCLGLEDHAEIWNNLGTAHKAENRNSQAEACWNEALKRKRDPDFLNNLATLYVNEGNPGPGLKYAEEGLRLKPDHARLHWNHSLLLLEMGRWKEGLEEYEWGFKSMDRPERFFSADPEQVPQWDGTPGKKVVVYGEQGVGDEIMFASCIPDMMSQCEVVFECHPRLQRLFERSFGVKCYPTRKETSIDWAASENLDARLSVGSLFKWFRPDGKFPRVPYLTPDPELVKHYRERLEAAGHGPYVGIGWRAGTKSTRADLRSLKLKTFGGLFKIGGTFVSLQYHADSEEKCQRYFEESGVRVHHWPEVVETGPDENNRFLGYDYDHTMALIAALDLVICPNTTAVHACGAMGKECWTITPSAPAWRYGLTGKTMPMYGSVIQYRGESAISRIERDFSEFVRQRRKRSA